MNEPFITVHLGESDHGILQPHVRVRAPAGMHYRTLNATLHTIATRIELAVPENRGWIVTIPSRKRDDRGFVVIELEEGTDDEARAAMAMLKELVG